ncbi:tyrosine-protein phosphatase [Pseudomonas sp. TCU-HL1]|uniref:tyrosine-protein phosphatase n=1 Tax=Pseudomonas sp. TCU-HL1 TaxID=1856685 RepID=UPI000858B711|nr:tyrosine-protein phosphatase [Pseudomonas sp. TCU-HL1]AOE87344.1 hypothetical protein THL1_4796 [Pseudomonas sp. TCU-HL1]
MKALMTGLALLLFTGLGSATPADQPADSRLLPLQGAANVRDLGGYRTEDGRRVKWGLLYRGGALDKLTEHDQQHLQRLGLQRVVDLRSPAEIDDAPDRLPPDLLARRIELPVTAGNLDIRDLTRRIHAGDLASLDLQDILMEGNRSFVREHAGIFRDWLHGLLNDQSAPVLFHCTAGKDRTGYAAAVLLLALGVPEATVMQDYMASNQYLAEKNLRIAEQVRQASGGRTDPALLQSLLGVEPRYLQAAFDAMREEQGSVDAYLRQTLGLDDATRAGLQERFLEVATEAGS